MAPQAGEIVWLASFPKSGNTWLRLLLANLLSPGDEPVSINQITLSSSNHVDRGSAEEMTLIDTSLLTRREANLLRPRVIEGFAAEATERLYIKVHDAYKLNATGEPLLGRGSGRVALYIIRDPRDVVISLSHYLNIAVDFAISQINSDGFILADFPNCSSKQFPQLLTDWSGHVDSWTGQRDLPVHVLRYEDLRADPVGTFGAAVAFLGIDASQAVVERAVRCADFAELQRQERQTGFDERSPRSLHPFFRAGRAGAWKDVLTPAQQEAIVAAHQPVMARFGYI